jgi:hypothetical protein
LSTSSVARPSPKSKPPTPLQRAEAEAVAALVDDLGGWVNLGELQQRLKRQFSAARVRRAVDLLAATKRVDLVAIHNHFLKTIDVQVQTYRLRRRTS